MNKKLEELRKIKFKFDPQIITEQEGKEVFNEVLRRVEWERGEMWLESRSDEEIKQEIISKTREVADAYFKRQAWGKMVDKLTESILRAVNKERID